MMFLRSPIRLSLSLTVLLTLTQFALNAQQPVRRHIDFDKDWKFHLGHAADPNRDFNYGIGNILAKTGDAANTAIQIDFDDKAWQTVQLPHDWAVTLPFSHVNNEDVDAHGYRSVGALFPESSIGWYRKTFTLNRADSGQRFELQFDGIFRDSKVWINNCYLGGHFSGYGSASYDITDFVRFNAKNTIVVRVDASQYEGWFYEGAGIYRHAWLNSYSNLHIASEGGVYIHTSETGDKATVTIAAKPVNKNGRPVNASVYTYLTDRSGKMVGRGSEKNVSLGLNAIATLLDSIEVPDAHRWSLEDPYLYRAVTLVRANGRVVDSINTRFGIRTITIDKDKGLFLNGKPVKVQGVCCHQDHAGVGSALPDYLQYYRIGLLKEMGVNAYRTSHNPPTPELLEACDSLGMLVMDETRLLNSGAEYGGEFERLILRDRNHPSIFIWSIGNEEWAVHTTNWGKRIALNQVLKQQELDPSRTSTYAANLGNTYTGVNEVIPVRGFNYNLHGLDGYRKDHPDQPIIGTEVASTVSTRGIYYKDTVNAYVPDYDSVAPPWASTAEYWWKIAAAREWFMGGFAWTGFDYRGEPTPYSWPNINSHFGIMDMCGFPKTVYYYYQSWWTDKDVLHIAPHWNWKGKEGQPIPVWINSNADEVELLLNGKTLGKKEMPRNGHLEWIVNYTPGKLEAIGWKKGKKITASVQTTGQPYKILVKASRNTQQADEKDATVFNVVVVDKQGLEVPDAANLLHFYVQGPGKIIGVGNGNPTSHEPDQYSEEGWQRKLFNGKAQVIIQSSTDTPGDIVLQVEGAGLIGGAGIVHAAK